MEHDYDTYLVVIATNVRLIQRGVVYDLVLVDVDADID